MLVNDVVVPDIKSATVNKKVKDDVLSQIADASRFPSANANLELLRRVRELLASESTNASPLLR